MSDPDIPVDPPLLPSTWTNPEQSVSTAVDISGSNGASASRESQKRQRTRRHKPRERSDVAVDLAVPSLPAVSDTNSAAPSYGNSDP